MREKITLRLFWLFMVLCAGSALIVIWFPKSMDERIIPTLFIIGLANFLIWAPTMVYRFYEKVR